MTLPPSKDSSTTVVASYIRDAYKTVTGQQPEEGLGWFLSVAGHLQAYGIPCMIYGPSGRTVTGKENWNVDVGEHLGIEDLTETAKVYIALILDLCTKSREELKLTV